MNRMTNYRGERDLLSHLQEDIGRLLSPFDLRTEIGWPQVSVSDWIPSIDVKEDDKQYLIHVDVPGVKVTDIDVSMENGLLTLKGKRKTEKKEEKENYLRVERSRGSFMRQLSLPEAIDQDKIEATCREGVLEIKLPKKSGSVGRKIKVKE